MTRITCLLLVFCALAPSLHATTAPDLRSRIAVDGLTFDFEDDEWVLDASTACRERPGDSRWGWDNDIAGIAVTWDAYNLYVAVPAVTLAGTLMLFLDTMCGGAEDLTFASHFRRNIEFGGLTPNFLLRVGRSSGEPLAGYVDCVRPLNTIEAKRYRSVYLQDGLQSGALELAIPWEVLGDFARESQGVRVPSMGAALGIVAVITGGEGTGAGDAAPDPSVVLEDDSTRVAVVDNHIIVPLDGDGDGTLDMDVSPRQVARYAITTEAPGSTTNRVLALGIPLDKKLFSPLYEGRVLFPVVLESRGYTEPVYLTAQVFSSAGHIVRTLIEEAPTDFSSGTEWTVGVEWDFKDDHGEIVPGGIYILAVSAGAGKGTPKNTAKASFAVKR
jgi:hypothetical protein